MTHVDFAPADQRPVEVLDDDGTWVEGWLVAYRNAGGVGSCCVRLPAESGVRWVERRRIRGKTPA